MSADDLTSRHAARTAELAALDEAIASSERRTDYSLLLKRRDELQTELLGLEAELPALRASDSQ